MKDGKLLRLKGDTQTLALPMLFFALNVGVYCLFMLSVETSNEKCMPRMVYSNALHTLIHALFFPSLVLLVSCFFRKTILFLMLNGLFYLFLFINSYYYNYFHSFLFIDQFSSWIYLKDIWTHVVFQLTTWKEILLLGGGVVSGALGVVFIRRFRYVKTKRIACRWLSYLCLFCLFLCVVKTGVMSSRHHFIEVFKHDATQFVKQFGLLGFYGAQVYEKFQPDMPLPLDPGKINPVSKRPDFGLKSGLNIIFLQVESLDARVLDVRVDGAPLMANLNDLKDETVYFDRFFAQHRGGYSQDAELSTLYSLLPSNDRSGFNDLKFEKVTSLMDVLQNEGYYAVGLHANDGSFFNRSRLFYRSGADKFYSDVDFEGDACGWYSKDVEFLRQSVEKLETLEEPFFAYLITMQSHGPFRNTSSISDNLQLDGISTSQKNYFKIMYEVDLAVGDFVAKLKKNGLWEKSIFVLYADHYSGTSYPSGDLYSFASQPPQEHIPLFIYYPGVKAGVNSCGGSHIDLASTLLNLLNLQDPKGWLGSSMFAERSDRVILNYPRPLVYRFSKSGFEVDSNHDSILPFIEWSEALQD